MAMFGKPSKKSKSREVATGRGDGSWDSGSYRREGSVSSRGSRGGSSSRGHSRARSEASYDDGDSSDDETGTVISGITNQDDWDAMSVGTSFSELSSVSKDTSASLAQVELSRMFDDERNVLVLLMASRPPYLQASGGRYTVGIKRASLKQPFGLSFHGTEGNDRSLSKISIAEDLPQFGIQRFDELVFVNQRRPSSISECRSILQEALSLTLVLDRRPQEGVSEECLACPDPCGKTGCAAACSSGASEAMRQVLAIIKPRVLDHDRLEFTLVVQRCSLAQKFGISFATDRKKEKKREDNLDIKVGTSVPQMGLKKGDKLVSINGVVPKSKMKCLRIYQTSLVVKMVFRRKSARKLAKLKAKVQEIEEVQQVSCSLFPSCF